MRPTQALFLLALFVTVFAGDLGVKSDHKDAFSIASLLENLGYQEKWQTLIDALNAGWGRQIFAKEEYDQHTMMDIFYNISNGNSGNQFDFQELRTTIVSEEEMILNGVVLSRDKGNYGDEYEMVYITDFFQNTFISEEGNLFFNQTGDGKILYKSPEGIFYDVGTVTVAGYGSITYDTVSTFTYQQEDTEVTSINGQQDSRTVASIEATGEAVGDRVMMQGIEVATTENISNDSSKKGTRMSTTTMNINWEAPAAGADGMETTNGSGTTEAEGTILSETFDGKGYVWNSVDSLSFPKGVKFLPKFHIPSLPRKL